MDGLLLHTCCGPCSTVAVPYWRSRGVAVTGLFFNPNIQPAAEYARRLGAIQEFAIHSGLGLVVDEGAGWSAWRETLPPGWCEDAGVRCAACLALRLGATAREAAQRQLQGFSTSLTLSPYQSHHLVLAAGETAAAETGVEFVYADLRERYPESVAASRRLGLYRQRYCGCVPSMWEAWEERRRRRVARRARVA